MPIDVIICAPVGGAIAASLIRQPRQPFKVSSINVPRVIGVSLYLILIVQVSSALHANVLVAGRSELILNVARDSPEISSRISWLQYVSWMCPGRMCLLLCL